MKGLGKMVIVEIIGNGRPARHSGEASSGIPTGGAKPLKDRRPHCEVGPTSDLSDVERHLGIALTFLLPAISKKLFDLLSVLNLLALRIGERPVGPDLDVDSRWLTEAIMSTMTSRVQDWR